MPIYEYRCSECGDTFEQFRRMSDADNESECPSCQSSLVSRIFSTFASGGASASGENCGAPSGSRFS